MEPCKKETLPTVKEVFETYDRETAEILVNSGRWTLIAAYGKLEKDYPPYTSYVVGRVGGQSFREMLKLDGYPGFSPS